MSVVRRRWLLVQKYPKWVKDYVRAGLLRNAFELDQVKDKAYSSELIVKTLKLVDIECSESEANDILASLNVGIRHFDEILLSKGVLK